MRNIPYLIYTFEELKVLPEHEACAELSYYEYFEWLKRAAEQGYAEAQFELALFYDEYNFEN